MDASRVGLPPKSVYIMPKITRHGDSLQFRTDVATNWPPLLAIGGIHDLIRALPGFTIDNVSALSAEELVTQRELKVQETEESGRRSLQAFVDCIKGADSHVSVLLAAYEAASADGSQSPQTTAPLAPQMLSDAEEESEPRQNAKANSLADQGLEFNATPTRGDDDDTSARR
jgi:hypothetical protein